MQLMDKRMKPVFCISRDGVSFNKKNKAQFGSSEIIFWPEIKFEGHYLTVNFRDQKCQGNDQNNICHVFFSANAALHIDLKLSFPRMVARDTGDSFVDLAECGFLVVFVRYDICVKD
jgi:hypothetical protein